MHVRVPHGIVDGDGDEPSAEQDDAFLCGEGGLPWKLVRGCMGMLLQSKELHRSISRCRWKPLVQAVPSQVGGPAVV